MAPAKKPQTGVSATSPAAICIIPGLRSRGMMQSHLGLDQTSEFVGLLYVHSMFIIFEHLLVFLTLDVCSATTSAWLTCLGFKKSGFQSSVHVFVF